MPYQIYDLNKIPDSDPPFNLHGKIMKKIYFLKLRTPLYVLIALSAVNLIYSAWHFFANAAEMQTFSIVRTMLEQFELSFDYFAGLFAVILENTSLNLVWPLAINLILIFYLINFINKSKVEANLNNF